MSGRWKDFSSKCRRNLVPEPRCRGGVEIPGTRLGEGGGGGGVGGYFMSHLLQDRRFLGPFIGKRIE